MARWTIKEIDGRWYVVLWRGGAFVWPVYSYATQDEAGRGLRGLGMSERRRLARLYTGGVG